MLRDLTMAINLKGVWWGCKYAILAMHNNPVRYPISIPNSGTTLI